MSWHVEKQEFAPRRPTHLMRLGPRILFVVTSNAYSGPWMPVQPVIDAVDVGWSDSSLVIPHPAYPPAGRR
jgi:hypothetical protein